MKSIQMAAMMVLGGVSLCAIVPSLGADPATQPAASQPTTGPTTAPVVINWDQASKHVGETATVTGPVKGTHVTSNGDSLILNIGKDFPDASRFTIMIAVDADHPADEAAYKGKTVTVTGKIELYRKVPEIKAKPAAVMIVPAP